jgi:DNA-binding response OmpR family regulator
MEKKLILLAEDEKDISEMYKIAFQQAGFKVVAAFNGEEAIRLGKEYNPDLILLDINMPKKDGFGVLKDISENRELCKFFKKTPIFILSNYSNQQDIEYCMNMGAQDYIVKAEWSPSKIVEKVKRYFKD